MPQGSSETNFLFLGFPGFLVRDGDIMIKEFSFFFLVWKLSLLLFNTCLLLALNYHSDKNWINFLFLTLPANSSCPVFVWCSLTTGGGKNAFIQAANIYLWTVAVQWIVLWKALFEMFWGCIVYLPVFFISELNFLFLMLVSFISPQGLDWRNKYVGDNSLERRQCT